MNWNFRHRLKNNAPLIGTMLTLSTPAIAEVLAAAGFDWLFIDGEHGTMGTQEIQSILQAVDHQLPCVVRIAAPDDVSVKKSLDVGAAGVIVPAVNTAKQTEEMVSAARYAPQGSRGVGLARANTYGMKFAESVASANDEIALIVQCEHAESVENIEAIAKVPGLDGVLIGPYDLSASYGKMGQLDDPQIVEAIEHVTKTCLNADVPLGIFGLTADAVRPYIQRGYSLIVAGVDTTLLGKAAKTIVADLR